MKIYKLPQLADMDPGGEYSLSSEEIKSDAVYLDYGRLRPGEKSQRLTASEGHEEIVYIIKGTLRARHGKTIFQASAGEAFHCAEELLLDNPNEDEAIYLAAGGRAATAATRPDNGTSHVKEPPAATDEEPEEAAPAAETPEAEEGARDDEFIITKE